MSILDKAQTMFLKVEDQIKEEINEALGEKCFTDFNKDNINTQYIEEDKTQKSFEMKTIESEKISMEKNDHHLTLIVLTLPGKNLRKM